MGQDPDLNTKGNILATTTLNYENSTLGAAFTDPVKLTSSEEIQWIREKTLDGRNRQKNINIFLRVEEKSRDIEYYITAELDKSSVKPGLSPEKQRVDDSLEDAVKKILG